eukprot:maker-scaffold_49-snap-gene-1.100-mRNA-1 protein AED:0.02 eAED:0.02 QI:0/0.25/0.2/1/1/1/5/96/1383
MKNSQKNGKPEAKEDQITKAIDVNKYRERYVDYDAALDIESRGFISRLFLTWLNPVVANGYKRRLEPADLWYLSEDAEAKFLEDQFNTLFEKYKKEGIESKWILWKILYKSFRGELLFSFILHALYTLLRFLGPFFLQLLTSYIQGDTDEPLWVAYMYGLGLGLSQVVSTILLTYSDFIWVSVGLKGRSMFSVAVFKQVMLLDNASKQKTSTGQMNTFLNTDVQTVLEMLRSLNRTLIAPFSLVGGLIYIYYYIGVATFAGVAVLAGFVPLSLYFGQLQLRAQRTKLGRTDSRIKYAKEVLQGIKIVKLYAWEIPVEKILKRLRDTELVSLLKIAYLRAFTVPVALIVPNIASVTSFTVYYLTHDSISPADAFTVVSLFQLIRSPFISIPIAIATFSQAIVSFKRIADFLYFPSLETNSKRPEDDEVVLEMKNANFQWASAAKENADESAEIIDHQPFQLHNLNLQVKKGELVALIGRVAQGKSSFVSAVLEEMPLKSGDIKKSDALLSSIGYCSQEAFIFNATVRENILFKKPYNKERYQQALKASCLESDLQIFPAGDLTEIGERGVTLSGGQKARVSIARAVYSQNEFYIFDDPLAAVDPEVGNLLFNQVLNNGEESSLKGKTKILVTNQVQFLPKVDRIVILDAGRIVQCGTYEKLMEDDTGNLRKLLEDLVSQNQEKEGEEAHSTEAKPQGSTDNLETERPVSQISHTSSEFEVAEETAKELEKGKLVSVEKRQRGGISWATVSAYGKSGTGGSLTLFIMLTCTFFLCEAVYLCIDSWLALFTQNDESNEGDDGLAVSKQTFIGGYWGITLLYLALVFVRSFGFAKFGVEAAKNLYRSMVEQVLKFPMSFFWETPLGTVINRLGGDTDYIDDRLPFVWQWVIMTVVRVLGILAYFCVVAPIFSVVIVPVFVIYFGLREYYISTSREMQRIESISRSPVLNQLGESLSGVVTIRAFNIVRTWEELSKERIDHTHRARFAFEISQLWLGMRLEFLGAFIIFFCAVAMIITAENGQIQPGLAGLSLSLALNITINLNLGMRMSTQVEAYMNAVERVQEYSQLPIEQLGNDDETKKEEGMSENGDTDIENKTPPLALSSWPENGRIVFNNVWLRYRENLEPALRDANMVIQSGETIGLVGRTGAGKSTIMMALFRIVDLMKGTVIIDGVDISKVSKTKLRSSLTLIPQDPVLFVGTLRENIDPFKLYSDEELNSAIERAHLIDTVNNLPNGLESEIAENGSNLSVGERALVCLARALIRRSKIVLLDEATASVDATTDLLIQETIRTEFRSKQDNSKPTMIIIAHRLQTIIDSDKICFLNAGRVAEFEHPHKLLNAEEYLPELQKSEFAAMVAEMGPESEEKLREIAQAAYESKLKGESAVI